MPTRKLGMYIGKMPQLEAERALAHVQQVAAAFGSMQEQDQKNYIRQLQVTANAGKQRNVVKPTEASLRALGIVVETLPPPKAKSKEGGGVSDGRSRTRQGGAGARRGPRPARP